MSTYRCSVRCEAVVVEFLIWFSICIWSLPTLRVCVCVCGVSLVCVRESPFALVCRIFFFFRGGHVLVTFGGGSNVGASPCKV